MKILTKVAIRMMALYYIIYGIMNISALIYHIGLIRDNEVFYGPVEYVSLSLPIVLSIIAGIILWIVAGKISNKILGKEDELATFPLPMIQTLQVALIIIGVVLILNGIPTLVSNIYLYGKLDGFQTAFTVKSVLIEQSVKIVIGILVVIFAPFITKNIFKLVQVEKTNEK